MKNKINMKNGRAGIVSIIIIVVIILLAIALFSYIYGSDYFGMKKITNFEECAAEGYPVMESFPRQCRTPDGRTFTEVIIAPGPVTPPVTPTPPGTSTTTALRGLSVSADDIIKSPFTVVGEARGWYFEASFPIFLLDGNGNQIAVGIAQAESNWMTTDFVPFRATLTFQTPTTTVGTLVFTKDNPSGLPEFDEEFRLPIRFR